MDREALVQELLRPLVEELEGGCWKWLGTRPSTRQHRVVFEIASGESLAGLVLRTCCETRGCINPAHFRRETYREMIATSDTPVGRAMRRTRCVRGHPLLDEANVLRSGGERICRACLRVRVAAHRARRRQGSAA